MKGRQVEGALASAMKVRAVAICTAVFVGGSGGALAGQPKPLKFWNLTANTITELYVAQLGTRNWSANLCLSDPDHSVEPDERLSLPGVTGGVYDVRVVDSTKRACLFHGLILKAQGHFAFSVSEEQMKACGDR